MKRALPAIGVLMVVGLPMMAAVAGVSEEERMPQGRMGGLSDEQIASLNTDYDGRFIFARVKFTPTNSGGSRGRGGRGGWSRDVKWDHDYPRAENNLAQIIRNITLIDNYMDGGNIINIGDPELFKYPWAYLCEPGFWSSTDEELENLRNYLFKGGFLVIDDFFGNHWYNFAVMMERLLPEYQMHRLDASHPIFNIFFEIEDLGMLMPRNRREDPAYFGVFEDNDPEKRLMIIINYDNDIGDWWEWSDMAYTPIELSNEAYKLGINYLIYSMSH